MEYEFAKLVILALLFLGGAACLGFGSFFMHYFMKIHDANNNVYWKYYNTKDKIVSAILFIASISSFVLIFFIVILIYKFMKNVVLV